MSRRSKKHRWYDLMPEIRKLFPERRVPSFDEFEAQGEDMQVWRAFANIDWEAIDKEKNSG